jgi:Protein of unknown function (DUF2480)
MDSNNQAPVTNKIAQSGLIELNPEIFLPAAEIMEFDIAVLMVGVDMPSGEKLYLLREKHFREQLQLLDISHFKNKVVGLYCSEDTLIPSWAWMLLSVKLKEAGIACMVARAAEVATRLILKQMEQHAWENYLDARVVIKGCSQHTINAEVFAAIAAHLQPYVKSMMYGEPCSTVPLFKRK